MTKKEWIMFVACLMLLGFCGIAMQHSLDLEQEVMLLEERLVQNDMAQSERLCELIVELDQRLDRQGYLVEFLQEEINRKEPFLVITEYDDVTIEDIESLKQWVTNEIIKNNDYIRE